MNSETYITLKIKPQTAKEFRMFSRSLTRKQTDTLQLMLDFFSSSGLSPLDQLGPNFTTLEKRIQKRINAVVAIIREIEKTQTRPTLTMLQLLFQQSPIHQEVLVEKTRTSRAQEKTTDIQLQRRIQMLQNKLHQSREITNAILERINVSRSSFGKVQLRLIMTQQELEEIKHKLENL